MSENKYKFVQTIHFKRLETDIMVYDVYYMYKNMIKENGVFEHAAFITLLCVHSPDLTQRFF